MKEGGRAFEGRGVDTSMHTMLITATLNPSFLFPADSKYFF